MLKVGGGVGCTGGVVWLGAGTGKDDCTSWVTSGSGVRGDGGREWGCHKLLALLLAFAFLAFGFGLSLGGAGLGDLDGFIALGFVERLLQSP